MDGGVETGKPTPRQLEALAWVHRGEWRRGHYGSFQVCMRRGWVRDEGERYVLTEAGVKVIMEAAGPQLRIKELEAEVKRLKTALEYYADAGHWSSDGCGHVQERRAQVWEWVPDRGQIARVALGLPEPGE